MIRSFGCPDTQALARGTRVKRSVNIESFARRELRRLCFRWSEAGADDVEIVDCH
jgi:hypothetical protein